MRQIKFRAWDKETQSMRDASEGSNFEVEVNAQGQLLFIQTSGFGKVIPMQFTGLKDKNGKEIYEGDIVINPYKVSWIVEWREDVGKLMYGQNLNWFGLTKNSSKRLEIIGNIKENLELLK